MKDVTSDPQRSSLKDINELIKDEQIKRCSCGSAAFFDCGIELVESSTTFPSPRYQDYADREHVKICVNCRKTILVRSGDLYDVSEYIGAEVVERYIRWRGGRGEETGVLKRAT